MMYRAGISGLVLGVLLSFSLSATAVLSGGTILDFRALSVAPPTRAVSFERGVTVFEHQWTLVLEDNIHPFAGLDPVQRAHVFDGGNRFLAGQIKGVPDSWVRLSWVDGGWSGGIYDGHELYLLETASRLAPMLTRAVPAGADLLVYRYADLWLPALVHAGPVYPGERPPVPDYAAFARHLVPGGARGASEFLPVTVVSDTQFTTAHGVNTGAVVASRINFIDGIYAAEVGVGIGLHHHQILASNGPLTSSDPATLLVDQFRPFMTTGGGNGIPFAGVAHLFTGRNLINAAGIAYNGVLCNTGFGFGVDENLSSETVSGLIFAHEVGHNFGAPHDNEAGSVCAHENPGGIMRPVIGPTTPHEFSNCSLQQMQSQINNATCFVQIDLGIIFQDRFE